MEEFVYFEENFKIFRDYKKDQRAVEKKKAETQSVEAHNTRMKKHREHDG
jgi:IS1 family transposase